MENSLTKAFKMGRNLFYSGGTVKKTQDGHSIVVFNNPYKTGTMLDKEFQRGFDSAYSENIERRKGSGW